MHAVLDEGHAHVRERPADARRAKAERGHAPGSEPLLACCGAGCSGKGRAWCGGSGSWAVASDMQAAAAHLQTAVTMPSRALAMRLWGADRLKRYLRRSGGSRTERARCVRKRECVFARLSSTERATARVMQEGSAGRQIRHQPSPLRECQAPARAQQTKDGVCSGRRGLRMQAAQRASSPSLGFRDAFSMRAAPVEGADDEFVGLLQAVEGAGEPVLGVVLGRVRPA